MKSAIATLALIVGATGASADAIPPTPKQYKFSLEVQVEDAPLVAINAALPLGTSHTLQAGPHLRFEVEVPSTTDYQSKTLVRLVDDSSGKPIVLHSAQTSGPTSFERDLAYSICQGQVTFYSGVASGTPTCKK
jgi:hypothetical protein